MAEKDKFSKSDHASSGFQKVRRTRFIHDILSQIEKAIVDGRYQVGDKLPSERELCEVFQTSRGPLREALRVLEQKGLVTIKMGACGGAFVKAVTTEDMTESLALLLKFKGVSLTELAEFRAFLEGATTALAAKRHKKSDLRKLADITSQADSNFAKDPRDIGPLLKLDSKFHMAIAKASGNRLFISVLQTVYDNMYQYQDKYLPREEKIGKLLARDMKEITAAIESGRGDEASRIMQRHVYHFNKISVEAHRKTNTETD